MNRYYVLDRAKNPVDLSFSSSDFYIITLADTVYNSNHLWGKRNDNYRTFLHLDFIGSKVSAKETLSNLLKVGTKYAIVNTREDIDLPPVTFLYKMSLIRQQPSLGFMREDGMLGHHCYLGDRKIELDRKNL